MVNGQLNMDTGNVLYRIYASDSNPSSLRTDLICDCTGKFALPALVTLQNIQLGEALNGVAGAIGSASMGNWLGLGSGIMSAMGALVPAYDSIGQLSDWAGMSDPIRLICAYQDYVPEDITHHGRPLCEVRQLSALSGYTQCENVIFSSAPTQAENEEIKNWLERGVYIE